MVYVSFAAPVSIGMRQSVLVVDRKKLGRAVANLRRVRTSETATPVQIRKANKVLRTARWVKK